MEGGGDVNICTIWEPNIWNAHSLDAFCLPSFIIWDPVQLGKMGITCQEHGTNLVPGRWHYEANDKRHPRKLHHIHTIWLVGRDYKCSTTKGVHYILSTSFEILTSFEDKSKIIPFILSKQSGLTTAAVYNLRSLTQSGLSFKAIETLLCQQQELCFLHRRNMFNSVVKDKRIQFPLSMYDSPFLWSSMSDDLITRFFINDFMLHKNSYDHSFSSQIAHKWISMDNTYKISANAGIRRTYHRKWEQQFQSLLAVMNEKGIVIGMFNKMFG